MTMRAIPAIYVKCVGKLTEKYRENKEAIKELGNNNI